MAPLNTDEKKVKAVFAFGRMNPPTTGHRRIVERLCEEAKQNGAVVRLYLSETHDHDRNPLTPQQKIDFAKKFFPEVEVRTSKTVFTAALEMAKEGVDEGVMIVGEDRFAEFSRILSAYSGTADLGLRAEAKAISRDDGDASASQARQAALAGDWEAFRALTPSEDEELIRDLFEAVRHGLGVNTINGGIDPTIKPTDSRIAG
jgi:nicotinamide mononucleotide adenylyltransferase